DNYSFLTNTGWDAEGLNFSFVPETNFESTTFNTVKGYTTGSKVRVLGTSKWLNSIIYYNNRYEVIQAQNENHLGGIDRVSSLYDFDGTRQRARNVHNSPAGGI